MAGRSKLAVILHADVVGSTMLVQKDEQVAHERIRRAFSTLFEHLAGRDGITHEVRGDAVVAEFARPSDAVAAAVGFQHHNEAPNENAAEDDFVRLRIGIAMGEVVIADNTVTGAGVVLAQRLEQLAPPGGVVVSAAIREAVSGGLAMTYTDLGERQLKGFDQPQRAYQVWACEAMSAQETSPARQFNDSPSLDPGSLAGTFGPRVAVLPLRNLSGDPEQEFFAEGLSEEITLALSASRSFPVLASSATLAYKNSQASINEAGKALGAQYVLGGSVRRAGNRIRVAVELVNVDTQLQVWSERYDRPLDDVFAVQDDITTTVVAIVEPEIDELEMRRVLVAKASNLNAYELAQRGFWHLGKRAEADYRAAHSLFEESIQHDERYARAYAGLAQGKYMAGGNLWEPREAAYEEALEFGRDALALDDRDPRALRYYGGAQIVLGRLAEGISTLRYAIATQPSYATAYSVLAFGLVYHGDFEDAVTAEGTTRRLRPGDRALHKCVMSKAIATYELGDYDTAKQVCQDSLSLSDTFWMTHVVQAATLGQLGALEDGRASVERVQDFFPTLSRQQLAGLFPFRERAHLDHLIEGLRKARLSIA